MISAGYIHMSQKLNKAQPLSKVYEKVILGWLFIIVSRLLSCYNSTIKNSSVDLLGGLILRSLLIFALPTLVSNIFQQLYNTADVMIVGRFLGPDAWATVGASSSIFDLVIGFALGVGNDMGGVVIACYYGAQKYDKLRQSVATTLVIGLGLSVSVMFLGHFGLYPLLTF